MRNTIVLLMTGIFFALFCDTRDLLAITTIGPLSQAKDEVVTGIYKGYKDGAVLLARDNGAPHVYPFEQTKKMLQKIAATRINANVTITVEKGIIIEFEVK